MLATALAPSSSTMTVSPIEDGYESPSLSAAGQRQLRKHKVLPRPRDEGGNSSLVSVSPVSSTSYEPSSDTSPSVQSSPRTLKHQARRIGSGPSLPPTPPRRFQTSSSGLLAQSSSPVTFETVMQTPQSMHARSPATPPYQQSPPTPDVTPPQPTSRPKAVRPSLKDRGASRTTTGGSRTESFTTAREEPPSSEEDNERFTPRPEIRSEALSHATMHRVQSGPKSHAVQPNALSLALESLEPMLMQSYFDPVNRPERPRSKVAKNSRGPAAKPSKGKGPQTAAAKEVSMHTVSQAGSSPGQILEGAPVTPTNAIEEVRQMSQKNVRRKSFTSNHPSTRTTAPSGPRDSDTSISMDPRRASAISTASNTSTVVEAFLVETPSQKPQRQRTLRHVRKHSTLRDLEDVSPRSITESLESQQPQVSEANLLTTSDRPASFVSTATVTSINSAKTRRDIWKSGGIPVVVIPDRRSSNRSKSREPSLRSTSSRRSKRSVSVSSVQANSTSAPEQRTNKERGPVFPRRGRQAHVSTDNEASDAYTMDYPPCIPRRSSSLSAPVSRNVSRTSSLTAESIKAHNALQNSLSSSPQQLAKETKDDVHDECAIRLTISSDSDKEEANPRPSFEHNDDLLFAKGGKSLLNTPFSVGSVETTGTAPELSEALAVHMYSHQNSSVLMVNHSTKPSLVCESAFQDEPRAPNHTLDRQNVLVYNDVPVTPTQPVLSLDDVDSPLRNPRAPPSPPSPPGCPPAINFIPATPSGMTPAYEKIVQMGNYFESMKEKPGRRSSLVRRAFSRRRHSVSHPPTVSKPPGFLARTFSLSRGGRRNTENDSNETRPSLYPSASEAPAEENKLHPFWRPQWSGDEDWDDEDDFDDFDEPDEEVYRYPPINNRPSRVKRSFSSRMRRTFAILPSSHDDSYPADDRVGPERRIIKRTPSGNLRVMRHRASLNSLRRSFTQGEGIDCHDAEDDDDRKYLPSNRRRLGSGRRTYPLSGRLEQIQSIPRRFSERRRQRRTDELRQKISGPREVRDGVGEVIRSGSLQRQYGMEGQI